MFFFWVKKKVHNKYVKKKSFPLNKKKGDACEHTQMETLRKGAWEMAYWLPLGRRPGGLGKGISFPGIFSCLVLLELNFFYHEHVFFLNVIVFLFSPRKKETQPFSLTSLLANFPILLESSMNSQMLVKVPTRLWSSSHTPGRGCSDANLDRCLNKKIRDWPVLASVNPQSGLGNILGLIQYSSTERTVC